MSKHLTGTVLIAAFEGWNDAGNAASTSVALLAEAWTARQFAQLDPDDFVDFQVNRPTVGRDAQGTREITWPVTTVWVAELPTAAPSRRIVLVHGVEPSLRWRAYCREILTIAKQLQVDAVISVGALLADVPHTRPLPVTATADDEALREELGLEVSNYEGPTGIVGVLQAAATEAGFDALSIWVAVPHYVANPPSPAATLAILSRLEEVLGEPVPLGELPRDTADWLAHVADLVAENEEVAEYVRHLEQAKDTADSPEASGDAIAQEFERWLAHRED